MLEKTVFYTETKHVEYNVKNSIFPAFYHLVIVAITLASSASLLADAVHVTSSISLYDEPAYPKEFSSFNYVNPKAPKGGKITLPALGTFDTLNPYVLKGISASEYSGTFGFTELNEPLMVGTSYYLESGDEPQSAYCLLCSHLEFPADYSWVIFQLNANARFHNGQTITADDVAKSYELLMSDAAHPMYANNLSNVKTVAVLSPDRIKFDFVQPGQRTSLLRVGEIPVMSKAHWQQHTFGASSGTPQPLSGPYRVKKFTLGNFIELERVKDFWAKDHSVYQGMFNFDQVRIEFYRDRTVAFESFKSGSLDFWIEYVSKNWSTAYNFPSILDGSVKKQALPHAIPSGTQAFFFNMRRDKFKDIKARKALSRLFDFYWINKNIFSSAYKRSQNHYPNSEMGSRGLPSDAEKQLLAPYKSLLPEGTLEKEFSFPLYENPKMLRKATREAINLLKEAGWHYENNLLVNKSSGEPFQFEILIDSPSFQRVLLPYVNQLKRAGIQANIRIVDPAQYKVRLDSFDFDMTVYVLPQSASPGHEQAIYFHSEQSDVRGSRNLSGIKDPVVDALVDSIRKAKSHQELVNTVRALDRVLLWNYYMIPNWHLDYHRLAYKDRFAKPKHPSTMTLGFQTWWIENGK